MVVLLVRSRAWYYDMMGNRKKEHGNQPAKQPINGIDLLCAASRRRHARQSFAFAPSVALFGTFYSTA
jgi:hypothetical protein